MVQHSRLHDLPAFMTVLACAVTLSASPVPGQDAGTTVPEGPGLAAKYAGDRGLGDDPGVVFVEDFEQSSVDDVKQRWDSMSHPEIMSLSDDVPAGSNGKQSLLMTHVGGQGDGGYLYRRLPPGFDKLHVRFYVKFDPKCARIHHFFHVGGYNPSTPYPQGGAGERPRGDERFSVGIEPFGDDWTWDYYAYWMQMRGSPPRGQTWGNTFVRDPQLKVARGEWICMETMIRLNDVGQSNGELALWVDGKQVSHLGPGFPSGKWVYDKFEPGAGGDGVRWSDARRGPEYFTVPPEGEPFEGFRWRSDEKLNVNFLWVLLYMTNVPQGHVSQVWFDQIVVATDYIGPLAQPEQKKTVRVGAAQPKSRLIDYRLSPHDALAAVDRSLGELEQLVHKAGAAGCDVVALPEDTLGLGTWEAGNQAVLSNVLPAGVDRMLDRLGRAAAEHGMSLICSNDTVDTAGNVHNTAFLLGPDGKETGRYHKVNMPIHELSKQRGDGFPVFHTPDLGDVGMLVCYDMVFPEAARCLALGGADIIFHPTLGGAAFGEGDISRAAFRTRAAENFVYVVVAQRGAGSMIISPQGKVLAEAEGADVIAIADIDPAGGRSGGDAFNHQEDMRARLFRERSPAAFGVLTDPHPPVLDKVPESVSIGDAVRIANAALTVGEEEFREADVLLRDGRIDEAARAFEELCKRYPATWIDRVARERLARLRDAGTISD